MADVVTTKVKSSKPAEAPKPTRQDRREAK